MHLHPRQGGEKIFVRPNLQEKCVSAPQDTKCTLSQFFKEILRTVFAGWLRFGGIFRRSCVRATTKKVVNFFGQKSEPRRQNPGYAYASNLLSCGCW